jgi:hypothetical protein
MYDPSADVDAKYGSIVGLCCTDDVDADVATDIAEDGDALCAGYAALDCEVFCSMCSRRVRILISKEIGSYKSSCKLLPSHPPNPSRYPSRLLYKRCFVHCLAK